MALWLVRQHLENGLYPYWPNLVADKDHLGQISFFSTRLVTGLHHFRYKERLHWRRIWWDIRRAQSKARRLFIEAIILMRRE